ncbi:hypothetical protein CY0110_30920, partial [Crocosphaera chwakensis CCY0110]
LNQVGSLPLDIDNGLVNHAIQPTTETLTQRFSQRRGTTNFDCGTRDKAYRQTVSRSNRGRKKSTTPLVSG